MATNKDREVELDPRLVPPLGVVDVRAAYGKDASGVYDDSTTAAPVVLETTATTLPVPSTFTILTPQVVRISPDGTSVVDVTVEIPDSSQVADVQIQVTKL